MTDPFEEFEFKPLTEGLGFHKKKNTPGFDTSLTGPMDSNPEALENEAFSNRPSSAFEFESETSNFGSHLQSHIQNDFTPGNSTELKVSTPLPRAKAPSEKTNTSIDNSKSAVDEILNTLNKRRMDIDFDNSKANLRQAQKQAQQTNKSQAAELKYVVTTINYSAAVLDAMLIMASSLLCMIALLMITHVDLVGNLSNPDESGMIYFSTISIFAMVSFIYLVMNRVFLGYTPGEWAFDIRLGDEQQFQNPFYAIRVAGRTLLMIASGFILIPFASSLMNKDLAGDVTGVSLVKRA